MANILGSITFGGDFGGWELINSDKLPQDVASGFYSAQDSYVGAKFTPIWYVAKQMVNGFNHLLIAEETRATASADKRIVALTLYIPIGDIGGKKAKIIKVVDSDKPQIPEDVKTLFDKAVKGLTGAGHKPVIYVGSQIVKGINFYIINESRTIVTNAKPYASVATLNLFNGQPSIKFDKLA